MKRLIALLLAAALLLTGAGIAALAESVLRLPESMTAIGTEAFYRDTSLQRVVLQEGLKSIQARAFAYSSVSDIYLPASLTYIADDAFLGCPAVHATVPKNSYAKVWCDAHSNVNYTLTDEVADPLGALTGSVRTAGEQSEALSNVSVTLTSAGSTCCTAKTDANGNYYIDSLPAGTYGVSIALQGYITFNGSATIRASEVTYMETFLMVEGDASQTGVATGAITDAFTGRTLAGVSLSVRSGWNNKTGTVLATGVSDENGAYAFELPIGNYTMTAALDGYTTTILNIVVLAGETVASQDLAIAPKANDDQYRIILRWGANPRDLDSHMEGKTAAGDRFHVFYSHKNASDDSGIICNLDVDCTQGNGPEAVTLTANASTPYYYYVHLYAGDGTIASSQASVEVYKGGALLRVYHAPTSLDAQRYWNVFGIVDGSVKARNTMTAAPETNYLEEGYVEPETGDDADGLTWADGTTVREEIRLANTATIESFSFRCSKRWTVTAPTWMQLTATGGAGSTDNKPLSITAMVKSNDGPERSGDLIISAAGCSPLVVHITQAGGGAAMDTSGSYLFPDENGMTYVTLEIKVFDQDDTSLLVANDVTIANKRPDRLNSDTLNGRTVVPRITEGQPYYFTFDVRRNVSYEQSEKLGRQEDAVEQDTITFNVSSEEAGSYEFKVTFDAVPFTTQTDAFEVYLADSIIGHTSYVTDVYNYQTPAQLLIQPLLDDVKFQGALMGWRLATFNVSSELQLAEKELDYYRAYVYTVICDGDEDVGALADTVSDASSLLGAVKSFVTQYKGLGELMAYEELSRSATNFESSKLLLTLSEFFKEVDKQNKAHTLPLNMQKWVAVGKAYSAISTATDVLDTACTIGDIFERIMQISKLQELTEEKRALLNAVAEQSDRPMLKAAVQEYANIYDDLTPAQIASIMAGEETVYALLRKGARAAYNLAAAAVPQIALAQTGAKLVMDVACNVSNIISAYYECEAAVNFENAMRQQVKDAEYAFIDNPDEEHAVKFLSALSALYSSRIKALKGADKYCEALLEGSDTANLISGYTSTTTRKLKETLLSAIGKENTTSNYNTVAYAQTHSIIEDAKKHAQGAMSRFRTEAAATYYDYCALWPIEESLTREK